MDPFSILRRLGFRSTLPAAHLLYACAALKLWGDYVRERICTVGSGRPSARTKTKLVFGSSGFAGCSSRSRSRKEQVRKDSRGIRVRSEISQRRRGGTLTARTGASTPISLWPIGTGRKNCAATLKRWLTSAVAKLPSLGSGLLRTSAYSSRAPLQVPPRTWTRTPWNEYPEGVSGRSRFDQCLCGPGLHPVP